MLPNPIFNLTRLPHREYVAILPGGMFKGKKPRFFRDLMSIITHYETNSISAKRCCMLLINQFESAANQHNLNAMAQQILSLMNNNAQYDMQQAQNINNIYRR